jgi:transposase
MNSVGIDLHRKRSFVAVIDDHGELTMSRRIVNDRDTFLELLGGLEGKTQIAVEATYRWEWLAELLEDAGYDAHLAHPLRTRAIAAARVKTDAVDAKTLAHLLRADLLPEAYIAPRELRDVRELLRPPRGDGRDAHRAEEPGACDPRQARHPPRTSQTRLAKPAANSSQRFHCATRHAGGWTACSR